MINVTEVQYSICGATSDGDVAGEIGKNQIIQGLALSMKEQAI